MFPQRLTEKTTDKEITVLSPRNPERKAGGDSPVETAAILAGILLIGLIIYLVGT